MTVQAAKLRLGAPDSMILFGNTQTPGPIDLGASLGGAELNYNPSAFQVEIDQAIMPVGIYETKEEISFDVALTQYQVSLIQTAFSYLPSVSTTGSGSVVAPSAPTVTPTGGAATSWSYKIIAVTSAGDTIPSSAGTTAVGAATLTNAAFNTITWTAVTNDQIYAYKIKRSASGGTPASTGIIGTYWIGRANGQALSFVDTGLAADSTYVDIAVAPTGPNIDRGPIGGGQSANGNYQPTGTFDWTVPKQDGTTNHLRGHLNAVASYKAIKLDFKREKIMEINKVSLLAIADLTQPVGSQAGFLVEER